MGGLPLTLSILLTTSLLIHSDWGPINSGGGFTIHTFFRITCRFFLSNYNGPSLSVSFSRKKKFIMFCASLFLTFLIVKKRQYFLWHCKKKLVKVSFPPLPKKLHLLVKSNI